MTVAMQQYSQASQWKMRILILCVCFLSSVMAAPYVALDMKKPRICTQLSSPQETKIDIVYEFVDSIGGSLASGVPIPDEANRMTSMLLEIRDVEAESDDVDHRLRKTLTEPSGTFQYDLKHSFSGTLEICIGIRQQSGRRYPKPSLVSMYVVQATTVDSFFEETEEEMRKAKRNVLDEDQKHARVHLNYLDRVVANLVKEANLLLSTADQIKDQESSFHQKSIDMNSASKWWPMLHIMVLLATGFTQANHIVSFFKSRHII